MIHNIKVMKDDYQMAIEYIECSIIELEELPDNSYSKDIKDMLKRAVDILVKYKND